MQLPEGSLIHIGDIGRDDGRLDPISNWMRKRANMFSNKDVLDIGSNVGHFPLLYQKLGARGIVAVEPRSVFHEAFIDLPFRKDRITWLETDIRDLASGQLIDYDIISTIGLLYHLAKPWETMRPILEKTNASLWIVEAMLFDRPESIIEDGDGRSHNTTSFHMEEVERGDAAWNEAGIRSLGYEPERIDLGPDYHSENGGPRGFWICRRNKDEATG